MDDQQDPLFVAGLSSKQEVMDFIAGLLVELEGHDVHNDPRDMARRFSAPPQQPADDLQYRTKAGAAATINGTIGNFIQRLTPSGEPAHAT
jgi:hypothetical protein